MPTNQYLQTLHDESRSLHSSVSDIQKLVANQTFSKELLQTLSTQFPKLHFKNHNTDYVGPDVFYTNLITLWTNPSTQLIEYVTYGWI